jgi:hypothetical protein
MIHQFDLQLVKSWLAQQNIGLKKVLEPKESETSVYGKGCSFYDVLFSWIF